MISVVLFTRAFPAANALVRRLLDEDLLEMVVAERRKHSRLRLPGRRDILDTLADPWSVRRERRAIERVFGREADRLWAPPRIEWIEHQQWSAVNELFGDRRPDVIVSYGTSIIPRSLFALAKICALN